MRIHSNKIAYTFLNAIIIFSRGTLVRTISSLNFMRRRAAWSPTAYEVCIIAVCMRRMEFSQALNRVEYCGCASKRRVGAK